MYGLSDRLKPLSAAEEQVLLAVWECPAPATRRDISEKLTATGWAPATVLNFLYRLEEKGWVKGGQGGEPEHLSAHGHPPGLLRCGHAPADGHPVRRQPARSGPRPCQ